jgi:hypothetical protein
MNSNAIARERTLSKRLKECNSAEDAAETAYLEAMGTIKTGF